MNPRVVRDIVAVILERRRVEGQQPKRADAQVLEVVELLHEPPEVADAVIVAVAEGANVELIDDRVLVPEHVPGRGGRIVTRKHAVAPQPYRRAEGSRPDRPSAEASIRAACLASGFCFGPGDPPPVRRASGRCPTLRAAIR